MNQEIVAVIPARGGSTRIKKKNLNLFRGKPLFAWAVDCARKTDIFSRIIVNSEDREILDVACDYGAEPYLRPVELADNQTFIVQTIQEMISNLRLADQSIMAILLPTCPLRVPDDVLGAYELFLQHGGRMPVVSVSEYSTPIQLAQFKGEDGRLDPVFPQDYRNTRSVGHRPAYHYNEAVVINGVGRLRDQTNLIGERPLPYLMPPERSLLIDESFQLRLAELLAAAIDPSC